MTSYRSDATEPLYRIALRALEQLGASTPFRDEDASRWMLPNGATIWLFRASKFATASDVKQAIEQCLRDRDARDLDVVVVGGSAQVEAAVDSARAPTGADAYGKIHVSDAAVVRVWAASRVLERAVRTALTDSRQRETEPW